MQLGEVVHDEEHQGDMAGEFPTHCMALRL